MVRLPLEHVFVQAKNPENFSSFLANSAYVVETKRLMEGSVILSFIFVKSAVVLEGMFSRNGCKLSQVVPALNDADDSYHKARVTVVCFSHREKFKTAFGSLFEHAKFEKDETLHLHFVCDEAGRAFAEDYLKSHVAHPSFSLKVRLGVACLLLVRGRDGFTLAKVVCGCVMLLFLRPSL